MKINAQSYEDRLKAETCPSAKAAILAEFEAKFAAGEIDFTHSVANAKPASSIDLQEWDRKIAAAKTPSERAALTKAFEAAYFAEKQTK